MPNRSSVNSTNPFLEKLAEREKGAALIWIVVACIQVLTAILVRGTATVVLICGIWNLYAGYCRNQGSKRVFTNWPDLVNTYEKSRNSIIFSIVLNAVIGGVIGVIGGIYDMVTRSYVLEHRDEFDAAEKFK